MKLRKILQLVATCVGVILVASGAYAGYISTQPTVEPGKWTSDYDGAMAYAEKNNIPMIVFWANVGCGNCEKIEKEMNADEAFQKWKDEFGGLLVFVESNSKIKKWIKDIAEEKHDVTLKKFPYMAVYWPKNASGEKVLEGFSAYKGQMSLYGANSNDSNVKQIMDTVNNLLEGWSAGSVTPTPDPEPDPEPTPDPEPDPEPEFDPAVLFKKSQKIEAVAYMDDVLFGKATITLGKYNARKDYLKVTFKIASFGGKSYSKSVNVTPDETGSLRDVLVKFKSPIGEMVFDIVNGESGFKVEGSNDSYYVEMGDIEIGGTLEAEKMMFSVEFDEPLVPEKERYDFIVDAPMGAVAEVKRGKTFSFGKSPTIKYKKNREFGTWELAKFDEDESNVNAVKLTYKTMTGAFSGSFKIYASNEDPVDKGKKPTIKKYTAKFSGYVVNGEGIGTVSVKIGKKTYTGTCSLQE